MYFIKSIIIYAFIIFASLPASDHDGIKGINIANILWVLMMLSVFIPKFISRKFYQTGLEKILCLLIAIIFISVLRGYIAYDLPFYQTWFYGFLKPLQFLILYIIIFNHFHTIDQIKNILFLNVIISLGLSILLLWTYQQNLTKLIAGESFMGARTGGIHDNPNSLTLGFNFSLLILFFLFQESKRLKEKIVYLLSGAPILLGILFSYTRKAWIAGIIGFIVYSLLVNHSKKIRKILFVLLNIGMIIFLAPDTVKTRAMTLGFLNKQNFISHEGTTWEVGQSEGIRLEFALSGIRNLLNNKEKIPFGGGMGDYENNAYKYSQHPKHKKGRDAHNAIVTYLCSVGLVGVTIILLFYSKIISLGRMLRRVGNNSFTKNFGTMIIAQIIVYSIYTLGNTTLLLWDYQMESIIFGSILGCAFILRKIVLIDMYENSNSITNI